MRSILLVPSRDKFPGMGGVREHLIQLAKCIERSNNFSLGDSKGEILHVESSFRPHSKRRPDVYVCHGGFEPEPIPDVLRNMDEAKIVISVARWMVPTYMESVASKTVVIPNGVDLSEYSPNLMRSTGMRPGYVLYPKTWSYHIEELFDIARLMPKTKFLTIAGVDMHANVPRNVKSVGMQDKRNFKNLIRDASCVILTGPEVCPTIMLEAWAIGTPIVFHNYDRGAWELATWGHSHPICIGALPYTSTQRAVKAIEACSEGRGCFRLAGQQKVADFFQWSVLFRRYELAYEAISHGTNAVEDFIEESQSWYTTRPTPLVD